jgi:uncharacterized protein with PQ loop repeat
MRRRYDIDDYNECIAWGASFFTVIYFIPKIAPFINILQGMVNFEDTPGFNITVYYINCFFWFLYGDLLFSDQMKYSYMITSAICLISMGIYLIYEIRKYFFDSILNFFILTSASWGLYRYFTVEFDDDVFLGRICLSSSVLSHLLKMYDIYRVIKDKNFNLIHIYNAIIHLLSEMSWSIYGVIDKDYYISISYGIGVVLCLLEILVYKKYKKKYPIFTDKNSLNTLNTTIGIENLTSEEEKKENIDIKIKEDIIQKNIKEKPVKIVNKIN